MAKRRKSEEEKLSKEEQKRFESDIVSFFVESIDNWSTYSKKRLDHIREMERAYMNEVRPSLAGRSNFPFPTLPKYIDELKGRLDDMPAMKTLPGRRHSKALVAKKVQAALYELKKPINGDWARQDRMGRTFSLFAGYSAFDAYTEVDDDGFSAVVRPIDHNDFVHDAYGGNDLEKHRAVGEFPVLRTESEIQKLVDMDVYRKADARRLMRAADNTTLEKNQKALQGRYARYKALGLDIENAKSAGEKIFALATMQGTFRGKRWLCTFDYQTRIILRLEPLAEVYKAAKGRYSIDLYQTHEDPNTVMCKAPADDMFTIHEGIRVKVNNIFDASTKELWGMKGYDPNFVPDPSELEWKRPDQLVRMRAHNARPISEGIHKFDTSFNYSGNIDFVKFLDTFLASVVGINPGDVSEETKRVGVLFGQLQKTAARLGVQNKSYSEMWARIVYRVICGMVDNMDTPMAVKLIGTQGVEWEELSRTELEDPKDFDIVIEGSSVEAEMNEARRQARQKSLDSISNDPDLKKEVSAKWLVEEKLKLGEWDDEEIRRALDVKAYGSEEEISRADMAVEQILKNRKPKPYPGAGIAFVEYLNDYAGRLADDDKETAEVRIAILTYAHEHIAIAAKNMVRKAMEMKGMEATDPAAGGDKPAPPAPGPLGPGNAVPTPPLPNVPAAGPVAPGSPMPA